MIRYFSLFIITLCLSVSAYAEKLYRHIPFILTTQSGDTIVVDYDFSGKDGIFCHSTGSAQMQFTYKGHSKEAALPVSLLTSHIPAKTGEELADKDGQFSILINTDNSQVSCDYLGVE